MFAVDGGQLDGLTITEGPDTVLFAFVPLSGALLINDDVAETQIRVVPGDELSSFDDVERLLGFNL